MTAGAMPHLVVLYTPQLDAECELGQLCRRLADVMVAARDDADAPVFPPGGVRVMAFAADHFATTDGSGDHAFCYLNLRMARGRSAAVQRRVGDALADAARGFFAPLLARRPLGVTLQIDEGVEVFDAKLGNLHPLFQERR